jgi:hypothetical protein
MRLTIFPISLLFVFAFWSSHNSVAQSADTTVVQTFTWDAQNNPANPYDSPGRRWFDFPASNNGVEYQKILMYYNLKCFQDGTAGNLGYPCGEWDYLTYTYLYDHTGVIDSTLATHPRYYINNADFDTAAITSQPVTLERQFVQSYAVLDNAQNLHQHLVGDSAGSSASPWFNHQTQKSVYLYRADELSAAGLQVGDAMGMLAFSFDNTPAQIDFLRIEYAWTNDSVVTGFYDNVAFQDLYNRNTDVAVMGWRDLLSLDAAVWDGTSGLLLRVSYTQAQAAVSLQALSTSTDFVSACTSSGNDRYMRMDWQDEVRVPSGAFENVSSEITIMLWQNGDANIQPQNGTIFEGVNSLNQRVLNVHLPWSNANVYWDAGNDGGYDRINKLAQDVNFEGGWNHWAFTKNCTTGSMKIYLNGQLWHSGTNLDNLMLDIQRFSIGGATSWSNFYNGSIDEFAVFNAELDANTIADWMNRDLNASHPNWSNLQVYYSFNEQDGEMVMDGSGHGHHAWMHGNAARVAYKGDQLWRNKTYATERPLIRITSGEFLRHVDTEVITVQEAVPPVSIVTYDAVNYLPVATDVAYGWLATSIYVIDSSGDTLSVVDIAAEYELNNEDFDYWQAPFEVVNRYELNRFISMYGIQLDLGTDGWTWVVDVTDWEPLLRDSVELESGNWQELLDMKFLFIEGPPARDVLRVERLWDTNQGLNNFDNAVHAITVDKQPGEEMWKLVTTNTGHQFDNPPNCAEFCSNMQSVKVNGQSIADWDILQECATNPLYPQGGTWIFDRAGWCPGMNSTTKEFELTPHVGADSSFSVDYDVTYNDYGNYVFFGTLIGYDAAHHAHDPEIDMITAPSNWKIHSRWNPICDNPRFILRNLGADPLTNLTIYYGLVGGAEESLEWSGNLNFMEREEVELTYSDPMLWNGDAAAALRFYIRLGESNNGLDENGTNNYAESVFQRPPTYAYTNLDDNRMIIILRTNAANGESSYTLYDQYDQVVFERSNFPNANTIYRDTIALNAGCYTFHLKDSDDDGLDFFANSDGTGYCKLDRVSGFDFESFERDFGKEIIHRFRFETNVPANVEESSSSNAQMKLYPNPARDRINLETTGFDRIVTCRLFNVLGDEIGSEVFRRKSVTETSQLNIEDLPKGVYFVHLTDGKSVDTLKFIKN